MGFEPQSHEEDEVRDECERATKVDYDILMKNNTGVGIFLCRKEAHWLQMRLVEKI